MTPVFVGGPWDGKPAVATSAWYVQVPDARDTTIRLAGDRVVTLFGTHTYERGLYGDWEYRGYKKPEEQ